MSAMILAELFRPPQPQPERYFVLVIKSEHLDAGVFSGSTIVGQAVRDHEAELLPAGCQVIRAIEVTKRFAIEEIR